jgi:hypothetical protein
MIRSMVTDPRRDEALRLAEDTIGMLELGSGPLTPIVLRGLRLARLLDNQEAATWLRLELQGYKNSIAADWPRYAAFSGREAPPPLPPAADAASIRRQARRRQPEPDDVDDAEAEAAQQPPASQPEDYWWPSPIEEIEAKIIQLEEELRALVLPTMLPQTHANYQQNIFGSVPIDAERVLNPILARRAATAAELARWRHITATVRGTLHEWLSRTLVGLKFGALLDTAFSRARARLDQLLAARAPDVARSLASAFERARSRDPEEWSQALTSCRRALKALADQLYPPTDQVIEGHELTDAKYLNRLIRFASDNISSASQERLVLSTLDSVVARAEALNDLASKGVHSDVDEADLELTIIHTYLLAGELLARSPSAGTPDVPATADGSTEEGAQEPEPSLQQADAHPKRARKRPRRESPSD